MSHQPKKRRLDDNQSNDELLVTFDSLSTDELARIFEYLSPEKIMLARLNKKMRDAATKTVVPISTRNAILVKSSRKYHVLAAMATALPNLQQIKLWIFSNHRTLESYNDGEDPDNDTANRNPNWITYDIGILSNFTRLRELTIYQAPLNGRYPMLFNFPLLRKFHIEYTYQIKWDLEMLAGLPSLEDLSVEHGIVTGNIKSLRVLIDTLSTIIIWSCRDVRGNLKDLSDFPKLRCLSLKHCGVTVDFDEISKGTFPALEIFGLSSIQSVRGNFMNLSHLPHLEDLNLRGIDVTGDIRDIGNDDFQSLKSLSLPSSVYGGDGSEFQRISDAPDIIAAVSTILKQRPNLLPRNWSAELSNSSPDWYYGIETADLEEDEWETLPFPPLSIKFVKAGSRLGWRWIRWQDSEHPCEINWLDPEPSNESDDYEKYTQELAKLEENLDAYKGFHQPPTEEEYNRICVEIRNRIHSERSWNDY